VKTPDGKTIGIQVKPSDTAEEVKAKIEKETGLPVPRQVLKIAESGNEIKNRNSLRNSGVQNESELTVEIFKLSVTVNTLDGKSIEVMVDPSDHLSDIKLQLEEATGVPAQNQALSLDGVDLSSVDGDLSNKTMADYGIKTGSVLDLEPKVVKFNIKKPNGESISVEVNLNDTGDALKRKIAEQIGMTVPQQLLKHKGNEFSNETTIKDMGILENAELTAEIFKIPVTVKNKIDQKPVKVMIDPTARLSDINEQLEKEFGIPVKNQKLSVNGNEMSDLNKTVNNYGIKKDTVLDLEATAISVKVLTPDGKKHEIEIIPSDTDDDIKYKIEKVSGMAVSRQVLKVGGIELPKGETTQDIGNRIKHGSEINVDIFTVPITVKRSTDSGSIILNVEPCDSIDKIKKMIQEETGIDAKKQILKFGEKEIVNEQLAQDYGISEAGVELVLEEQDDPIIFVDIKSGTLFALERNLAIDKGVLSLIHGDNKLDFEETTEDALSRNTIFETMKKSPKLGVSNTKIVEHVAVDDYKVEKHMLKNVWGVSLKHHSKNKEGEEFFFIDPKTKQCGELSRKTCIKKELITLSNNGMIHEGEEDVLTYDKYISMIRNVFGMKKAWE